MEYFSASSYIKIVFIKNYGYCFVLDVQLTDALQTKNSHLFAIDEILWCQSGHVTQWNYMIL